MNLEDAVAAAAAEAKRARSLHGAYHSAHEAYGVLAEEVDEFWEIVRMKEENRSRLAMAEELIQVAAVALLAAVDLGALRCRSERCVNGWTDDGLTVGAACARCRGTGEE